MARPRKREELQKQWRPNGGKRRGARFCSTCSVSATLLPPDGNSYQVQFISSATCVVTRDFSAERFAEKRLLGGMGRNKKEKEEHALRGGCNARKNWVTVFFFRNRFRHPARWPRGEVMAVQEYLVVFHVCFDFESKIYQQLRDGSTRSIINICESSLLLLVKDFRYFRA